MYDEFKISVFFFVLLKLCLEGDNINFDILSRLTKETKLKEDAS